MAIFQGIKREQGTRSNTHLIISGHGSPACDFVLDSKFKSADMKTAFPDGVLFHYMYGGPGVEDVVIPKGRLVGVGKAQKNFHDGITKTPITLPGLSVNNNVIGMVPYNITKDWLEEDMFGGNKPSVITSDYVVLPYMPTAQAETDYDMQGVLKEEMELSKKQNMPWGAVLGKVEMGDYLKATPSGRCTKWVKDTDNFIDVVGQVYEMDLNQESWGWEKWMLWEESAVTGDETYINKSGTTLPTDYGYPYDPSYADGRLDDASSYQSIYTNNPTGITGIHDGSGNWDGAGRNDTLYKDMELGKTLQTITNDTYMTFQAIGYDGSKAKNIIADSVKVKIDSTDVKADDVVVDELAGIITVKVTSAQADKKVTASYKMKHYGTPSYLDFKGVVGSVKVLLKK